MSLRIRSIVLASVSLLAAPVGAQQVKGTATYLQRITLPPDAVFEAHVEDVSRADAKADTVGSVRIMGMGNPPFPFAIDVDPKRVDARRRYSVRATISVDGRVMFTTDRAYPVLTQGNPAEVALLLRAAGDRRPAAKPDASTLDGLPATFGGDLPCADCPAIRYRLNLFPDRSYFLSMAYVDRNVSNDDIGSWRLSDKGRTLTLQGSEVTRFRVVDADTLRLLDRDGRDIDSKLNYTLKRSASVEVIEPRLKLRGMYKHFADSGTFTECLSGQRWMVAQLGDNAALESEYLKVRREPGQEVLVSVEGQVKQLPPMEGTGTRPTLVVNRFIGASPRETCGPRYASADLLDTNWVLTALSGKPVLIGEKQREPNIVLHSKDQRVAGFSGCNRVLGGYTLKGDALSFGQLAGTMMACVGEGMELEQAFLAALGQVAKWKVTGQHLELADAAGKVLARFEARPLR
jgi:copper homeostasis protein (lipoprotein)